MNLSPHQDHPQGSAFRLEGQLLDGRYQVERLLGSGGMAAVYLARQLQMGRRCAVKVLLAGRAAQPEAAARFEREAELAGRVSHPNLCHVYDFGWTPEGLPWLAMEYLEGRSLASALEAGPLPLETVARIASGCAAGLAAAHQAGIVHRDLKPANVMLVPRDGREDAVVMDFGIAWAGDGADLTRDGMMVGTPEVMSPEQIAGDPVDARSDQYQLALLVCRMLTGQLPFRGATTQETMVMRLTEGPARLAELAPEATFTSALQAVLDRGLARRPEERYPGIADLAAALGSALASGAEGATELLPRAPGRLEPGPRGARRQTGRRPGGGLGWLLGLGAVSVIAFLAVKQPWRQAVVTPPPPPASVPFTASPGSPGSVPPAQPPGPAPVAMLPVLPVADSLFSPDSATRAEARRQAELVYRSPQLSDSVRAEAAYLVAQGFLQEHLPVTAREWLELCLGLQERKMCRQLLTTLP